MPSCRRAIGRSPLLSCVVTMVAASACFLPGASTGPRAGTGLKLTANAATIPANYRDAVLLTLESGGRGGPIPSGRVLLTTDMGRFVGAPLDSNARTLLVDFSENSRSPTARVECVHPDGVALELGTMHITATLPASSDFKEQVSNTVVAECVSAPDRSGITVTSFFEEERLNGAGAAVMTAILTDFHGDRATGPGWVRVESPDGLGLWVDDSGPSRLHNATVLEVPYIGGFADFFVQSPGQSFTRLAPVPFRLLVSFLNRAGATIHGSNQFLWVASDIPNQASVKLTAVDGADGDGVLRHAFPPARARLPAAAAGAWVDVRVDLSDWDGLGWRRPQDVTITCVSDPLNGAAGVDSCAGLAGRDPAPGGTQQVDHAPQVVVTVLPGGAAGNGPTTSHVVRFQVPAGAVPGALRLVARATPEDHPVVASKPEEEALLSLVDNRSFTVWHDSEAQYDDDLSYVGDVLSLVAFTGERPASGVLVCVSLAAAAASLGYMDDGADDVGGWAAVLPTDTEGRASIWVRPRQSAQGVAVLNVSVVQTPYTAELDDNTRTNQVDACSATGGGTVYTGSQEVRIVRD